MAHTNEKDWITQAGLRAVVLMIDDRHRCGYVEVPVGHPLHGASYSEPNAAIIPPNMDEPIGKRGLIPLMCATPDRLTAPDIAFDVHGSITFAGGGDGYPADGDGWWFGFDCAHSNDAMSPEYYERMREEYPDKPFMHAQDANSVFRSLEYCVAECESLARQIVERTRPSSVPPHYI